MRKCNKVSLQERKEGKKGRKRERERVEKRKEKKRKIDSVWLACFWIRKMSLYTVWSLGKMALLKLFHLRLLIPKKFVCVIWNIQKYLHISNFYWQLKENCILRQPLDIHIILSFMKGKANLYTNEMDVYICDNTELSLGWTCNAPEHWSSSSMFFRVDQYFHCMIINTENDT